MSDEPTIAELNQQYAECLVEVRGLETRLKADRATMAETAKVLADGSLPDVQFLDDAVRFSPSHRVALADATIDLADLARRVIACRELHEELADTAGRLAQAGMPHMAAAQEAHLAKVGSRIM